MAKVLYPSTEIVTVDTDSLVTLDDVLPIFKEKSEVILCVRSGTGNEHRGGYFFNTTVSKNGACLIIHDFEGKDLVNDEDKVTFSFDEFIRFVNHASGRKFDREMYELCKSFLNFKEDL